MPQQDTTDQTTLFGFQVPVAVEPRRAKVDKKLADTAQNLAIELAPDDEELPKRFRKSGAPPKKIKKPTKESDLDTRFWQSVDAWIGLIEMMLKTHANREQAWRFLRIAPDVAPGITKVADCQDFSDLNDYLDARRSADNCDDEELGRLAALSVALQRKVERQFLPPRTAPIKPPTEPEAQEEFGDDESTEKTKRRSRTTEFPITFVDGYASGWRFAVPEQFKPALDIALVPRREKNAGGQSETVYRWTQGTPPAYAFQTGDVLYDTRQAYGCSWPTSLQHINYCLQIAHAEQDQLVDQDRVEPGSVAFGIYRPNASRDGLVLLETRSMTQAEFVDLLRKGLSM